MWQTRSMVNRGATEEPQRRCKGKAPLYGKSRKWCPVPLCQSIIVDVGRHLTNPSTHAIPKDSREYQRLLRTAKPYTSLAEMEDAQSSSSLSATGPQASAEHAGPQKPPEYARASATSKSATATASTVPYGVRDSAGPSVAASALATVIGSPAGSNNGSLPSPLPAHPADVADASDDTSDYVLPEDDTAPAMSLAQFFMAKNPKNNRYR